MAKPVWPPLTLYAKLNTDPAFKLAVQTAVKTALDDYEEVRRPASQPADQPAAQPAVELLLTSLLLPPPRVPVPRVFRSGSTRTSHES